MNALAPAPKIKSTWERGVRLWLSGRPNPPPLKPVERFTYGLLLLLFWGLPVVLKLDGSLWAVVLQAPALATVLFLLLPIGAPGARPFAVTLIGCTAFAVGAMALDVPFSLYIPLEMGVLAASVIGYFDLRIRPLGWMGLAVLSLAGFTGQPIITLGGILLLLAVRSRALRRNARHLSMAPPGLWPRSPRPTVVLLSLALPLVLLCHGYALFRLPRLPVELPLLQTSDDSIGYEVLASGWLLRSPTTAPTWLPTAFHSVWVPLADEARRITAFARFSTANPLYWRTGVYYTLKGNRWVRPKSPQEGPQSFAEEVPRSQWERERWEKKDGWVYATLSWGFAPRPAALLDYSDVSELAPSAPSIRRHLDGTGDYAVGGGFAPAGVQPEDAPGFDAALNAGLASKGASDNPVTRALARRLSTEHGPEGFLGAWLSWLDAHAVYDLDRTAPSADTAVADEFLAGGADGLAHGTCVDFATATAIALQEAGYAVRVVGGHLGWQWNPYAKKMMLHSGNAHAWVEYLPPPPPGQPFSRVWQRLDPTAAITRHLKTPQPLSDSQMWWQTWKRNVASFGAFSNSLSLWEPGGMGEKVKRTLLAAGAVLMLLVLSLVLGSYVRRPRRERREAALLRWVNRTSAHWSNRCPAAGKAPHEGLVAWVGRVLPATKDEAHALAEECQAFVYASAPWSPTWRHRWKALRRERSVPILPPAT